ncbi:MAG: UDP-N-acetylmuramate--L-alanine ligase [Ferruginibacter sp.]
MKIKFTPYKAYNALSTESNKLMPAKSIYFIGIGGIGMSAIARYYKSLGYKVSGYDKTQTELTDKLIEEGILVHFTDDVNLVDRDAELVVYTPAVPTEHKELNFFKQNNFNLKKRSEVLGDLTKPLYSICVAGTHGKTTTSCMVAHILRDSGYGCNAFLGGVATNYNTNFWASDNKVAVAEADEYDRSFLQLNPDIAIITSMDPDHLDIYGTEENMQDAFISFSKNIETDGVLICKNNIERIDEFFPNKITYSLADQTADCFAENVSIKNGAYYFDVSLKGKLIKDFCLNMGGGHNVENVIAAIAAASKLEIEEGKIKKAVASFKGVKRRFEYVIKNEDFIFIDDYAHHPRELSALISGTKEMFPDKKVTVIFQPHLFSRTRDLAEGFSNALDMADEIILLPIYPARELPIENVSSKSIAETMTKKVLLIEKEDLIETIKFMKPEVLITAGAGDIDKLVKPLKNIFS